MKVVGVVKKATKPASKTLFMCCELYLPGLVLYDVLGWLVNGCFF